MYRYQLLLEGNYVQPPSPIITATSVVTTAKAQVLAVCCARLVGRRRRTRPIPACASSMVQWAQSSTLLRTWADEWVFGKVRDSLFRLPFSDLTISPLAFRAKHLLCVTVSDTTLGVIGCAVKRTPSLIVCGCVGLSRVLVSCRGSQTDPEREYDFSILDLSSPSPFSLGPTLFTAPWLGSVKCNRTWVVGLLKRVKGDFLYVRKLLNDTPDQKGEYSLGDIPALESWLKFSPLCNDVAIVLSNVGHIRFVDLEASFTRNTLVTILAIAHCGAFPVGVMWLADGTPCALHTMQSRYYLVDRRTDMPDMYFPELPFDIKAKPIGKNHALVVELPDPKQFQVYHTGNSFSERSLYVPCTWVRASSSSGLILSTNHRSAKSSQHSPATIQFTLHDGISASKVGIFNILLPPDVRFDKLG